MPPAQAHPFCSVATLQRERRVTRWIDELGDEISAFYREGHVKVLSTVCPHFGGDFDYSPSDGILRCRWHGWKFDVSDGRSLTRPEAYRSRSLVRTIIEGRRAPLGCFPFKGRLRPYDHRIDGDQLLVIAP
ncbi:MAG: Rieske (2Fe-2S) protein [Myxococcales bacterium]|nr:Rieske (2Fe-2S) protein [Myxococcales bacterium]